MLLLFIIGTCCIGPFSASETIAEESQIQYVNWKKLSLPCRWKTEGAADIVGLRLWWTDDKGNSWQVYPTKEMLKIQGNVDYVSFTVPHDGMYGFKLQVIDSVGNKIADPLPGDPVTQYVVVDTKPPDVTIFSPGKKGTFYAGQVIDLKWEVRDKNCPDNPVKIYYIPAGKKLEIPITGRDKSYPSRGSFKWPLPLVKGEISFKFKVEDKANNSSEVICGPYKIDPYIVKPKKHEVVAETFSKSSTVPVFYRFSDINPESIGEVDLYWYASDYKSGETHWQLGEKDIDLSSPVIFHAPHDGWFGLYIVVKDKSGSDLRPLKKLENLDTEILVDTHAPQVKIQSVTCKEVEGLSWIQAGDVVKIQFVVSEEHLKKDSAAIKYSLDLGKTWYVLADGLSVDNLASTVYEWTIPHFSSDSLLLRALATDKVGWTGYDTFKRLHVRDLGVQGKAQSKKLIRIGRVLLAAEKFPEALKAFKTAVGFAPDNGEAHFYFAKALKDKNDLNERLNHLRKAVELSPTEISYRIELLTQLIKVAEKNLTDTIRKEIDNNFQKIKPVDLFKQSDFQLLKDRLDKLKSKWKDIDIEKM